MDANTALDPLEVLRQLTPEQVSARIAALDGERTTLARLLRSMRAGERAKKRSERITVGSAS